MIIVLVVIFSKVSPVCHRGHVRSIVKSDKSPVVSIHVEFHGLRNIAWQQFFPDSLLSNRVPVESFEIPIHGSKVQQNKSSLCLNQPFNCIEKLLFVLCVIDSYGFLFCVHLFRTVSRVADFFLFFSVFTFGNFTALANS
jgi:hypothetical protein